MDTTWTVGEVAELAHVTVRTLHHYDEIGLLVPSERSDAGYRLYSDEDLERLHAILLYRELDLPLDAIRRVLDDPDLDREVALRSQRERLVARRRRIDAIVQAVDRALESIERGMKMSTEEIFDGFDAFARAPEEVRAHQAEHGPEAWDRWGGTDAWKASIRRARSFSEKDWARMQEENEANEARMAALLAEGADPAGEEARAAAEAMRQHIGHFYPCSHEMHAGLADMYEADERFKGHYEERAEGLAAFVAAAVRANAATAEGGA